MQHWALKYTRGKWSPETDCFWWFRKISKEQFGRNVGDFSHGRGARAVARDMRDCDSIAGMYGYVSTPTPREGDAVFLSLGNVGHHIGMAIFFSDTLHVLHVLEESGVVVSDLSDLAANGWRIVGYFSPLEAKNERCL